MALATKQQSVAGLIPVSMIDWEGKLASIVFLAGCNLRCPYCHNPELVNENSASTLPFDRVIDQLNEKKDWVDGVVLTGGEPTLNEDIFNIIAQIKQLDLKVKLDTNGTRPKVVKRLLKEGLIDFLAIDVKTIFSEYDKVVGIRDQGGLVQESVALALTSNIDHEFRTTVVPGFVQADNVLDIAKHLAKHNTKRYFLQQFNPRTVLNHKLASVKPFPPAVLEEMASSCREYLPTKVRGVS